MTPSGLPGATDGGEGAARELLAQAGFARALARKLVWDASHGDDLVQEAWLAVLGRKQPLPGGPARPFWRAVLHNLARQGARSQERRARHEAQAPAVGCETPADATAQRLDLAERLLRSVRELEEPYRSVIALRYFEELSPRAAAARLGLPLATLRTQERRALARLRILLDRGGPQRRPELLAALLPLAGSPPWTWILPLAFAPARELATGTLAMKTATKWTLAAALLALGGIAYWTLAPKAPALSQPPAPEVAAAPLPAEQARSSAAAPPAAAPLEVARQSAAAAAPEWQIAGRLLRGTEREPFPGGKLLASLFAGDETQPALSQAQITCDPQGNFTWSAVPPAKARLLVVRADEPNFSAASVRRELGQSGEPPRDLVLRVFALDASLSGKVRDAQGAPVAGALVRLPGEESIRTDVHGDYRLRLPASNTAGGRLQLQCWAQGLAQRRSAVPEIAPGGEARVDFELHPEFRIRGRVSEAGGRAVVGASVTTFYSFVPPAVTDEAGRFLVEHLDRLLAEHLLIVEQPGFVKRSMNVATEADGEAELDVVLDRGARVAGRVLDEQGRPVADARLYIGFSDSAWNRLDARSGPDGRFEFPSVQRGKEALVAQKPELAPARMAIDVPEGPAAVLELEVVLGAPLTAAGRVVDRQGQPLEGIHVVGRQGGEYIDPRGKTDAQGRFVVKGLPRKETDLEFYANHVLRSNVPVDPERAGAMEVVLDRTGHLAGSVVDAATHAPVADFVVRFVSPTSQAGDEEAGGWSMSWARQGLRVSDPQGRWKSGPIGSKVGSVIGLEIRAEGYAPGLVPRAVLSPEDACEELRVELVRGAVVRGHVVDGRTGLPLEGVNVRAQAASFDPSSHLSGVEGLERTHATVSDARGFFELRDLAPGKTALLVSAPDRAVAVDGPFEVGAGPVERRIELRAGWTLAGRLLDTGGQPLADQDVRLQSSEPVPGLPPQSARTDAQGHFLFEKLQAPSVYVQHLARPGPGRSYVALSRTIAAPREERVEVLLQAQGPASLRGELFCSKSTALPEWVAVQAHPVDQASDAPMLGTLAHDGRFEFEGLAAGKYLITASASTLEGPLMGSQAIEVGSGSKTLTLELAAP